MRAGARDQIFETRPNRPVFAPYDYGAGGDANGDSMRSVSESGADRQRSVMGVLGCGVSLLLGALFDGVPGYFSGVRR